MSKDKLYRVVHQAHREGQDWENDTFETVSRGLTLRQAERIARGARRLTPVGARGATHSWRIEQDS